MFFQAAGIRRRKIHSEKCTTVSKSVNKCRGKSALRLAFCFSWCCFFAIQVSVQKCWDELKEHCTQIKVGFLEEFLLPAFRQERAQKRVCSEATQEEVAQS